MSRGCEASKSGERRAIYVEHRFVADSGILLAGLILLKTWVSTDRVEIDGSLIPLLVPMPAESNRGEIQSRPSRRLLNPNIRRLLQRLRVNASTADSTHVEDSQTSSVVGLTGSRRKTTTMLATRARLRTMTRPELEALLRGLVPVLKEAIDRRIDERLRDLTSSRHEPTVTFHQVSDDTLRTTKPHVRFKGIWDRTTWYARGDGILHQGIGWRCRSGNSNVEPGTDPHEWERLG
jgi:hypothetical protein